MGLGRLYISPEGLLTLLRAGRYDVIAQALPDDATAAMCAYDEQRHCLVLIVGHASIPEVPEGDLLPVLPSPTIRRVYEEP